MALHLPDASFAEQIPLKVRTVYGPRACHGGSIGEVGRRVLRPIRARLAFDASASAVDEQASGG